MLDRVQEALRDSPSREDAAVAPQTKGPDARLDTLTAREREVFDRLVAGDANKTIAYDLGISIRTVESHRANIMGKLNAKSLVDLVLVSLER
nr:LuxR C-terminal-related transcriptional regulator [Thiorhodococcus minor]